MLKKKKVSKEVEEVLDIVCNKCGKSCVPKEISQDNCVEGYGLIEASVRGGYYSPSLYDDVMYKFSICEECLRELFDNFVIPPQTFGCGLVCPEAEREYETKEKREKEKLEWESRKKK